jgi:hypothetical protein
MGRGLGPIYRLPSVNKGVGVEKRFYSMGSDPVVKKKIW